MSAKDKVNYFDGDGLGYDYIKHIKTPGDMGGGSEDVNLEANSRSIGNYINTIVAGGGGEKYTDATKHTYTDNLSKDPSKTRHALGNRYLIHWGTCKKFNCDISGGGKDCDVTRAKLVNNIPKGDVKGLLFGIVENVFDMLPTKYLDAFNSGEDKCFPCEISVTNNATGKLGDTNEYKKQVWVSKDDFCNYKCKRNWPDAWDKDATGFKVKSTLKKGEDIHKDLGCTEDFQNMGSFLKANQILASNVDNHSNKKVDLTINDPFANAYTLGVGLLILYLIYENLQK
tara:strand:- start:1038 stop:1892 length:855 start_codon:yes stop_codon:yes gene_type:complete